MYYKLTEALMIDNKLKSILLSVQKPARYTGGELNSVIKNKEDVKLRYAFTRLYCLYILVFNLEPRNGNVCS